MSRIVIVILIYHCHKPVDNINLLSSYRILNVFPVRYGQTYRVELSFKQKTRHWIMFRICDSYINIPSPQKTYRSYLLDRLGFEVFTAVTVELFSLA
jgi:hypothetical protein